MNEPEKIDRRVIMVSVITYCTFLLTAVCFMFLGDVLNHDGRYIWVIGFCIMIFFCSGYFSHALNGTHKRLKWQLIVAMIITALLLMYFSWHVPLLRYDRAGVVLQ